MYTLSRYTLLYRCCIEEVLDYYDDGLDFEVYKAEILIGKLAEALAGEKGKNKKANVETRDEIIEKYGNKKQKEALAKRRKEEE